MTTKAESDRDTGISSVGGAATSRSLADEISRSLFESVPDALVVVDDAGRVALVNTAAERLFGYETGELLGKPVEVLVPQPVRGDHATHRALYVAHPTVRRMGAAMGLSALRKDGTVVAVDIALSPLASSLGSLTLCAIRDATERAAFTEELKASERRLRALVDQATDGIFLADRNGRYIEVNNAACTTLGYTREQLLTMSVADLLEPGELRRLPGELARLNSGVPATSEWRFRRADGTTFDGEVNAAQLPDSRVLAVLRDVTARKRKEEEQRRARRFTDAVAKASLSYIYVFDLDDGALRYLNRSILRDLGYDASVDHITSLEEFRAFLPSGDADRVGELLAQWRDLPDDYVREAEYRIRDAAGAIRWCFGRETVFARHPDGRVQQILGTLTDITSLKVAGERLKESEARFRTLIEDLDVGVLLQDATDDTIVVSNRAAESMLGMSAERLDKMSSHKWPWKLLREDGSEYSRDMLPSVMAARTGVPVRGQIVGSLNPETGGCRWLQVTAMPRSGPDRVVRQVLVTMTDVTSQRLLEQQLRQSQKMQAIGQLAGGIAHDFNNLLTVISGCTQLALMALPPDAQSVRLDMATIRDAADRAALLTRQLLLFSRKGVWEEAVVDLNDLVRQASRMLSRLIGEDVIIVTRLDPALPSVRGDATQFEQVVLNLALNARDAMPNGGNLTIETSEREFTAQDVAANPELHAGHFVRLAVTDTGIGIAPEMRTHLFEPFFTTKSPGKGTGLGLSTVYGIVQQAGAFITVDSEVGVGSTFAVYIPAVADRVEQGRTGSETARGPTGTETVLVVEDEPPLRSVIVRALRSHGYRVLDVGSGAEALQLLGREGTPPVDLLLTDVVMPGIGGPELAGRARALRPGLRALFMSGYSPEQLSRESMLAAGDQLLQKPFTPRHLADKVREVLDVRR